MQKTLETWFISISALLVSAVIIGVFFASTGNSPMDVFASLYRGAFASWFSWQNTLVRSAPIMLTALCMVLPARVGLIVIGGEGAMVIGGLAAALTGIAVQNLPPFFVISAMLMVAIITGGLWIAAVGALRYFRNVNETISSLLLNYIAIAILNFLVVGILRAVEINNYPKYLWLCS